MALSTTHTENTNRKEGSDFRVSDRVTLRPGDKFRTSGGPYYEINENDGTITRSRMRDKSPFTFLGWFEKDGQTYLKAFSQEGFTLLNLGAEHRHPDLPSYVKAPYRNIRRVWQTKRERSQQRTKLSTKAKSAKKNPKWARKTLAPLRGNKAAPMEAVVGSQTQ